MLPAKEISTSSPVASASNLKTQSSHSLKMKSSWVHHTKVIFTSEDIQPQMKASWYLLETILLTQTQPSSWDPTTQVRSGVH